MKYGVQILLFLAIICNCISGLWENNNDLIISWNGSQGYPAYYHYWYLFNHKIQFFIYLSIGLYLLSCKYDKTYARNTILLYMGISALELLSYLYYGTSLTEEQNSFEYALLLGSFTFGTLIFGIMRKSCK
jgi:hypothetical protein